MPLGERLKGRLRHGVNIPASLPFFLDDFSSGDFSKWTAYSTLGSKYADVVTTPTYEGDYAAKLYSDDSNFTPLMAKVFPAQYDTLFYRSYVNFLRIPTTQGQMYHVACIGRYVGAPYWSFVYRPIEVGIGRVSGTDTKWYWHVNTVFTTVQALAGQWHRIELLSSRRLGRCKAWLNGTLLREIVTTLSTVSSIGHECYPSGMAVVDVGLFIDYVSASPTSYY